MTTKVIYCNDNYTEHNGLLEVRNWLLKLHGKPKTWGERGSFIWESALAIVNGDNLPPTIKEGFTNRDWRAANDRIATVRRILDRVERKVL